MMKYYWVLTGYQIGGYSTHELLREGLTRNLDSRITRLDEEILAALGAV